MSYTDQTPKLGLETDGRFDMKLRHRLSLLILFITAFAALGVLIYAYWIVHINRNDDFLTWSMLALTGVCVAAMVVLAVATKDMVTRWLSVGLIGVVGFEFSALSIASIGILIAPFALVLTIISCFMLIRGRLSSASVSRP